MNTILNRKRFNELHNKVIYFDFVKNYNKNFDNMSILNKVRNTKSIKKIFSFNFIFIFENIILKVLMKC